MSDLVHVSSGDSLTVGQVLGFEATAEIPTVVHQLIGLATPDFTVVAAGPRSGTWKFMLLNEADGTTCQNLLRRPGIFAVTGAPVNFANLSFYVTGALRFSLDDGTLLRIVVEVDWTEVR